MSVVTSRPSLGRSLLAGLGAGAVAGIVASLVSLPLRSPDDAFFNTASVTAGALLLGLVAGAVWYGARGSVLRFLLPLEALFLVVVIGAVAIDLPAAAPLKGAVLFIIPLAIIAFALTELLTPLLAQVRIPGVVVAAPALAALALGIALAGHGDAQGGQLSLPDLPAGRATSRAGEEAGPDAIVRPQDVAGVAFVIDSSQSVATYTVREKLVRLPLPNDAVGRTNAISGTIYLDGRPSTITVDLRTLQSDQPQRDNFIRRFGGVQSERFPFAEFTVSRLDNLPAEYRPGETVVRDVTGTMKIRDVERPLTFATESRLVDGVLQIKGSTTFTWADFQIPPPNVAGVVQVEDSVHLEVLLIAKREGMG
jgi:polyisoprenoid-binding protein YceI